MNEFFSTGLGKALLIAGIVLLAVLSLGQLMSLRYIGTGVQATNTITVNGEGEMYAVPDIATFTFSVVSEKSTVAAAQEDATTKANAVTKYLTDAGVDKKDIQTTDYSIYPQYDYQTQVCPTSAPAGAYGSESSAVYCGGGKQILRGYQVRQTTTIKVRDTAKAGDLLAGVGSKGATEVSSLNFTFDDPNKVQDEARSKAIADAKAKADELAKQLGVSIVRVVSYSDSGSGMPYGVAYGRGGVASSQALDAKVAPEISVGQNKVTSNVSITYEIR